MTVLLLSMGYEIIDISGDIGIRAYGKTCEEAFVNAGAGMFSLITDIARIDERREITIEVNSESLEGLLVRYLNELIFQFDAYGFVGKKIDVDAFNLLPLFIKIRVYGEEFDLDRHERRLLVKAATYHNVKVEKSEDGWVAEVIFDI